MLITRRALLRFAAIFAGWTAWGLLIAVQTHLQLEVLGRERPAWSILAPSLVGGWFWALYTPPLVMLARRLRRLRERENASSLGWVLFLGAHFIVATVVAVADAFVWARVRPLIDGVALPVDRVFAATLLMNAFAYIVVMTVTEAVDFASRWREREEAAAALARTADALRRQLDEARLRALEAQLRPHFLYNTLNLIAELVHREPEVADEMLTHLGLLLRRSYSDSPQLVPLREEMRFIRGYAEILARRYRDRVHLTLDVPPELGGQRVPAFLLQPLVENAFRHGVERREAPSAVDVGATSDGTSVLLRVRDRRLGPVRRLPADETFGIEEQPDDAPAFDVAHRATDGIGLRNTRERLALLYADAAGLTLVRSGNETVASVWVPLSAPVDAVRAGDGRSAAIARPDVVRAG